MVGIMLIIKKVQNYSRQGKLIGDSLPVLEGAALAFPTYTYSALGTTAGVKASAVVIYWSGLPSL